MRIGIDARELSGRATGVGRYLRGLLAEWSRSARHHEFVLYAPEPIAVAHDTRRFLQRTVGGRGGTWWEQVVVPRAAARDHLDIWFAPAYSLPLRLSTPSVVAIHDVSFAAHPEWFRPREGIRQRFIVRHSARRARAIVTISEFSKSEIVEHLGVLSGKIRVVPPGIRSGAVQPAAVGPPSVGPDWGERSQRLLYVGSIFTRRHVPELIRAFAPIARAHPDAALDLIGDNRTFPRQDIRRTIAAEQCAAQVRYHEFVSDERLRSLYAGARAFAFLSEYEGLGLTPLEALAAGVPPLLLDTPVAREGCGDAAIYVRTLDRSAVTAAIERALFSETARAQVMAAAPRVLEKYSWPRAAADTLALLERSA